MALENMYSFKMLITLFPFLFSIIGFLGYLSNGEIINSIFFFFGLLLAILTGYIFKVLKIGTKQRKNLNNICGVILPNYLFEYSTISLNQLFYSYVLTYIFGISLLNGEWGDKWHLFSLVFIVAFTIFDMLYFNGNKCSDVNEIFFGFVLGLMIALIMLSVKMRYYGNKKSYSEKKCHLNGNNKYVCKETKEMKKDKELKKANMVQEYNKREGLKNPTRHLMLMLIIFSFVAYLLFVQMFSTDYGSKNAGIYVFSLLGLFILCFIMYFVKITTMNKQYSEKINIDEIMGVVIICLLIVGSISYGGINKILKIRNIRKVFPGT